MVETEKPSHPSRTVEKLEPLPTDAGMSTAGDMDGATLYPTLNDPREIYGAEPLAAGAANRFGGGNRQ